MMEESAHQNQRKGPALNLKTFAGNANKAAGNGLGRKSQAFP